MTVGGLVCQEWSSQTPHEHSYGEDFQFPLDGSVIVAKNYCRDVDGLGTPWCYTVDENVRWDYCDPPTCYGMYSVFFPPLYYIAF